MTGFDSKKLNTLYIDKNLDYHGLLQAFSRTNRVLNERKRFGKIICFRDLKSNVDASIKLFSNGGDETGILNKPFEDIKQEYVDLTKEFIKHYPDSHVVDYLQNEDDKRKFILEFPISFGNMPRYRFTRISMKKIRISQWTSSSTWTSVASI